MFRIARVIFWTLTVIAIAALSACESLSKTPIDDLSLSEGMVRVDVSGVDAVYRKPNADLSKYNKLILRPVHIEFSKDWERNLNSSVYRMNMDKPDGEKIKADLAENFAEVFKRELETEGHYQIVTEPAADVLEVQPAIINLYITAPAETYGRNKTYTTSSGEMTLLLQLHDSVTGKMLGRAYDQEDASTNGTWQWSTKASNTADARRIIDYWAERLRKALDASRSKKPQ